MGVRQRIAMYLGSADNQGVENGIQKLSQIVLTDTIWSYGDKICVTLYKDKVCVEISDEEYLWRKDENVEIFSKHIPEESLTESLSKRSWTIIGAKATCLSSKFFRCISMRARKICGEFFLEKAIWFPRRRRFTK